MPAEVAEAVRTLIRWAGDDPDREGLLDTPKRVARAWRDMPRAIRKTRRFTSLGHSRRSAAMMKSAAQGHSVHVALRAPFGPIIGKASIAYLPRDKVVGIAS